MQILICLTLTLFHIAFNIPVPFRTDFVLQQLKSTSSFAGLVVSIQALCTLIATPLAGAISDRFGRKPVIVFGILGTLCSHFLWTLETTNWYIVAAVITGISAVVPVACTAMMVDVCDAGERSSKMGLLGAATGLGFLIGVWIGGTGSVKFGFTATMWIAMAVNVLSMIVALFGLKETLKPKKEEAEKKSYLERVKGLFRRKDLAGLATSAMLIICLNCSAGSPVTEYPRVALNMSPKERGYLFMVLGTVNTLTQASLSFIMKIMQTFMKYTPHEAEIRLTFMGAFIFSTAVLSVPFTTSTIGFLTAEIMWGIGGSLSIPTLYGMVSKATPESEQGVMMGILDSCGNLGVMLGPFFGNVLLEKNRILPFVLCISSYLIGVAKLSMNIPSKKKKDK